MTVSEILDTFGFYFVKTKSGKYCIFDKEDDHFEEYSETVQGIFNIISGHIESELDGTIEYITDYGKKDNPDTSKWHWEDYANYMREHLPEGEKPYWYSLIEICDALSDIKNIEVK